MTPGLSVLVVAADTPYSHGVVGRQMARPQTSPNVRGPVGVPDKCGSTVASSRDRLAIPVVQSQEPPLVLFIGKRTAPVNTGGEFHRDCTPIALSGHTSRVAVGR